MDELVIEGINFTYKYDKLLSDIFFNMESKGVFGLFGLNGVGKTTFFNCLSGFNENGTGMLKINGKVIKNKKRWKYFSYLNQKNFLPFDMSVKNVIKMFQLENIDDERIEELYELKIGKLSGG